MVPLASGIRRGCSRAVVGSQVGWESKAARQLKLELKVFPKGSMYPITRYLGFG